VPSGMQMLFYAVTLVLLVLGMQWMHRKPATDKPVETVDVVSYGAATARESLAGRSDPPSSSIASPP